MSLAEDARAAVRRRPFLVDALRAGVLNYTAAARFLADEVDRDADPDAVATALRRYGESLGGYETETPRVRVSMQSGLDKKSGPGKSGPGESESDDALLAVGDVNFVEDGGSLTGILAAGEVDTSALAAVLGRLSVEEIDPVAAGAADDSLLVVVERRDGPDAVRLVEDALDAVPRR